MKIHVSKLIAALSLAILALLISTQNATAQSMIDKKVDAAANDYQAGHYHEAARRFRDIVELDPKFFQAWYFLGQSLFKIGDVEGAREDYEKVLKLQPTGKFADHARQQLTMLDERRRAEEFERQEVARRIRAQQEAAAPAESAAEQDAESERNAQRDSKLDSLLGAAVGIMTQRSGSSSNNSNNTAAAAAAAVMGGGSSYPSSSGSGSSSGNCAQEDAQYAAELNSVSSANYGSVCTIDREVARVARKWIPRFQSCDPTGYRVNELRRQLAAAESGASQLCAR
jgi:cytochrome c-type biogenesis protein CcmH/NrfG